MPEAAAAGIDRIELVRRAAQAAQLGGEFGRAAHLLREAIEVTGAQADPVRVGLLQERLGRALWTAGEFELATQAYERAVELVPETPASADLARVLAGHSQVLMLGGKYNASRPIAERAHALARETGARQIEGHAATTLGVDLAYIDDAERGIQLIRDALVIAEEVGDFDDIGRSYACLSSALDIVGRLDEAHAVAKLGTERMANLGMGSTYGAFIQMNAVDALTQLGRWDEALRLAEAAAPVARGNGAIFVSQQLARLYTLRGDLEAAGGALEVAARELRSGVEAQFNGPLAVARVEHALWRGDIAAGRAAADAAMPVLEQTEDFGALGYLYAQALRVEAEAAEHGRAARDDAAVAEAERRAESIAERLRRLDRSSVAPGYQPLVHLPIAIGMAEATRVAGTSDPDAWRTAAEAAEARPVVYYGAYSRFREAEAMLAARGMREQATEVLAGARSVAGGLGARPLLEAIDALAARARLTLDAGVTDDALHAPAPGLPDGVAGYDLTARELEVLRLVAAGRTNRQIGDALFISESTAGVHVSRILGKLGVAGRVEAATIAARLGLAD